MSAQLQALTEKEKQALRLMGRGHDAKSMARHLGLSVHTVHDRLRIVRRKLEVSSSREAARLLIDSENEDPDSVGDKILGAAALEPGVSQDAASIDGRRQRRLRPAILAGAIIMSIILAAAALLMQPASAPADASRDAMAQAEAARTAQAWLGLVDAGDWQASWRGTGRQFQSLNTVEAWEKASVGARVPLGAVVSRTELSRELVPAPPYGYQMVKFRTDFANRAGVVETVTLAREGQAWKVVGIMID